MRRPFGRARGVLFIGLTVTTAGCYTLPPHDILPTGGYGITHYPQIRRGMTALPTLRSGAVDWSHTSIALAELGEAAPRIDLLTRVQRSKLFLGVTPVRGGNRYMQPKVIFYPGGVRADLASSIDQQLANAFETVIDAAKPRPFVLVTITAAGSTAIDRPSFLDFLIIPAFVVPTNQIEGEGHAEFWLINTATGVVVATGRTDARLVGHTPPVFADHACRIHLAKVARQLDQLMIHKLDEVCR